MEGLRDLSDISIRQGPFARINHVSKIPSVDEQHLPVAINGPTLASSLVLREKPETDRDPGRPEQLRRQRHHARHQIGLDDLGPDLTSPWSSNDNPTHWPSRLRQLHREPASK